MAERPQRLVAHTPPTGTEDWHWLDDHLRAVAEMAAGFAAPFGGEGLAWWAGILHDLGKAHPDFQDYLWKNYLEPDKKHPSVDHKTAGAMKSKEVGGDALQQILHAHHGGLSDKGDLVSKLRAYIQLEQERLQRSLDQFGTLNLISPDTAKQHPPTPPAWFTGDPLELEMLMRMLFSALVDADGLDTEGHMNASNAVSRSESWPDIAELDARFRTNQADLDDTVRRSDAADSTVNQVRREVYDACVAGAAFPPGFFRMTVPTGGGKTRSGLAFALRHAVKHDLRRVIVAVPFITITEQTADVYKQALGADALIEHHSGLEPASKKNDENPDDAAASSDLRRRLAAQNWDAPLIVTTTVQLFESLFTNRTSKSRKLHNLAGSVIILDEIQTLPPEMRGPILSVLHELVRHYRVTVVLSTATQPVLDTIAGDFETEERGIVELAPDPPRLFAELKRVRYAFPCLDESWDWERVADEMRGQSQAMTIVNTIKDAAALFATLNDADALHLSTRMCGAHRRDALAEIRRRLKAGEPCLVVSTQLVEAGVDLDFPMVLRDLGPLDRIVQAAGRCNREGKLAQGRVIVFRSGDGSMPPGLYRQGADETMIMLRNTQMDMDHPSIFLDYFERLYGLTDSDRKAIQGMRRKLEFASVDDAFEMIQDDSFPVLVNYPIHVEDESQIEQWNKVRTRLANYRPKSGSPLRHLMREVQPWLVQVRRHERDRLLTQGSIAELVPDVIWEWRDDYDLKMGIKDTRLDPGGLYAD